MEGKKEKEKLVLINGNLRTSLGISSPHAPSFENKSTITGRHGAGRTKPRFKPTSQEAEHN